MKEHCSVGDGKDFLEYVAISRDLQDDSKHARDKGEQTQKGASYRERPAGSQAWKKSIAELVRHTAGLTVAGS